MGEATLEDVPVTDTYRLWADACAEMFGGLQILSIDCGRSLSSPSLSLSQSLSVSLSPLSLSLSHSLGRCRLPIIPKLFATDFFLLSRPLFLCSFSFLFPSCAWLCLHVQVP